MAVSHRSQSTVTYATRTNTTFTAPASIADGDILVIAMFVEGGAVTVACTPPAGFATFNGYTDGIVCDVDPAGGANEGEFQIRAWWKRAASESGNYTVTHASTGTIGWMAAHPGGVASGDPTTDPIATQVSDDNPSATTITIPGGTTANNGNYVICVGASWNGMPANSPPGTPPTFTERYDPVDSIYIASGEMVTAGATGNKTLSNSPATNGAAGCLLFLQAAAAGAVVRPRSLHISQAVKRAAYF